MTELDFLPDWHFARQERRRGYFAFVWLGVCLLGVMGLWFYLAHGHIRQCRAELQQLQSERAVVNEQLLKIDKLRAVRDDLTRKSTIAERLQNRLDAVHVLYRLVELVPEEVSLVDLELQTEAVKDVPASAGTGAKPDKRPAGQKAGTTAAAPAVTIEMTRYLLTITGVAPVDASIASFIARLSSSKEFSNVQMGYTRDVKRGDRLMRQFELTCQLVADWGPAGGTRATLPARSVSAAVSPGGDGGPVLVSDRHEQSSQALTEEAR